MEIVLYVVPHCPLCAQVREWLKENNAAYTERDVSADFGALRAMYHLSRQRLVPVIQRDERYRVRPSRAEVRALIST